MTSAVDFPNPELRALSSVIHLLGVSILSYCFARRTVRENILSFRSWGQISWPRWLVILVFLDSWLFIFFAGVLISGVGMARSSLACNMGIYSCIIFYASSKVLIYLFLIEKVYVVWPNRGTTRWTSRAYLVCLFTMSGYVVIIVLMILGKIAYHRTDGQCIIGLETLASVSLLSYDLFLNVFLTGMFIWPLTRSKFVKASLRRVASRTLIAALAALTTSTVNIAVLTVLHGKQLGWVCLGSCGADVTINAMILFWVTSSGSGDGNSTPAPPVAVSNRTVKTTTHRQGTEGPRFSVKLPNETTGSSPGRLTFATSGPDGQPHSYPPAVREEDEDSADTEKKDGKPKKFFRKVGNVFGLQSKDAHARETQQMSVQVTITTEYDVLQEGRYKRDDDGDDSRRMPSVDYAASSTDRTPR